MAQLDLRPLSLGEILDRTFSLYRRHFMLFLGITAIPNLLVLAYNLATTMMTKFPVAPVPVPTQQLQARAPSGLFTLGFGGAILVLLIYWVVYLFAQNHLERPDSRQAQSRHSGHQGFRPPAYSRGIHRPQSHAHR